MNTGMRHWGVFICCLVLNGLSLAESTLPSCKGQDVSQWHACRGVLDNAEFSYAGDFMRGKFDGRGILEFTSEKFQGDSFQGEFKNGLKHGFGIYFFANGEKYVGQYQFGKRQGKGTYSFPNGQAPLSGNWSDNQWLGPAVAKESKNSAIQMQTIDVEAVKKKTSESDVNKQTGRVQVRSDLAVQAVSAKPRDAVAIVIGIQNYQRMPVASFATNDASEFREHAIRYLGVQPSHVKLLLDANAQRADVLLALKYWLPAHVNPGSTDVYVFFSGHGMARDANKPYYWLPHDVNTDLLEDTAISLKSLLVLLGRSAAKSVTVFADSCYSGTNRQGQALVQHQRAVNIKHNPDSLPAGVNMLTATASTQTAFGDEALQHGIFSFYLLQGLAGASDANKDRQINLGELADYVSRQTTRHALGLHKQQDPQFSGDRQQVVIFQ